MEVEGIHGWGDRSHQQALGQGGKRVSQIQVHIKADLGETQEATRGGGQVAGRTRKERRGRQGDGREKREEKTQAGFF